MSHLATTKELAEALDMKEAKIRRWTKMGILSPIRVSKEDGKSYLYHLDCVKFKLEILDEVRMDFSTLKDVGVRFREVFGRKDSVLVDELNKTENLEDLRRKYEEKVRAV